MRHLPLLTTALARRIERHIGEIKIAELRRVAWPDDGTTVFRFGETVALLSPTSPRLNAVYGFGERDVARLDAILDAFRETDPPPFYIAPMDFGPRLAAALRSADYSPSAFSQSLLYGLSMPDPPPQLEHLTIETVTPDAVADFAAAVARGFEWPESWREGAKRDLASRFAGAGFHAYLARYKGKPAGGGVLEIREGDAWLSTGAVDPELRGHGCHLALLRHRMHAAHALGCEVVFSGAEFGNASFRNQQRVGLQVAYIETTWTK